jgi:hypothetical protein
MPIFNLKSKHNIVEVLYLLKDKIHASTGVNKKTVNIAFLGYTDVMLTDEQWNKVGIDIDSLENRPNSESLKKVHGRGDVGIVPTLHSVLKNIFDNNYKLCVFDFTKYEGDEIEHDFNFEIPIHFEKSFDIIIDHGTTEHIFNYAQVLTNIQKMLTVNGLVFHAGPMFMPNHGFYCFNPTLFADFYEDNGCSIVDLLMRADYINTNGLRDTCVLSDISKYERFNLRVVLKDYPDFIGLEWALWVVAEKLKEVDCITFPIQNKYRVKNKWT